MGLIVLSVAVSIGWTSHEGEERGVPSAWCEISFPLTEICWIILLLASSTVMVNSSSESFGTGTYGSCTWPAIVLSASFTI